MIKTTPTAGHQYQVKLDDRLNFIEQAAYGYITNNLEQANPSLSGRPISAENRPTIYAGNILNIPLIRKNTKDTLPGKSSDEFTLVIGGREIETLNKKLLRTMDTPSDGWTASIAWTPGLDDELDKLLIPYSYPDAQFYIGGKLKVNGFLFIVTPTQGKDSLTVSLEGFSATKNAIDSSMPTPYEESNVSLGERAGSLLSTFGLKVEFDVPEDDEKFDRATAEITDKCGTHLMNLGRQRGYLSSSTPDGDWLFTKFKNSTPVDTIRSGGKLPVGWAATFDGTKVFSSITAIGESPGAVSNIFTSVDDELPKTRFMSFKADEANEGNLEKSADWERTKQYADSLTIPFPVNSIFNSKGDIWEEGQVVTVVSPEIFVSDGFNFLIRNVEYNEDDGGKTAILNLIPPSLYSGGEIVLPWR